MNVGTLLIFSGLPGSGKSTLAARLASALGATYLRIDTVEQGLRDVCNIAEVEGMGYRLSYRIAQENLKVGNLVIADSVNDWKLTRNEWNNVAKEIGSTFVNIEIFCSDKFEHRRRVEERKATVPGLKMPSWADVEKRDYHPWDEERILIDTSGRTIEECLQDLRFALAEKGIN